IDRAAARRQLRIQLIALALRFGKLHPKLLELPEIICNPFLVLPLQKKLRQYATARHEQPEHRPLPTAGHPLIQPSKDADQNQHHTEREEQPEESSNSHRSFIVRTQISGRINLELLPPPGQAVDPMLDLDPLSQQRDLRRCFLNRLIQI